VLVDPLARCGVSVSRIPSSTHSILIQELKPQFTPVISVINLPQTKQKVKCDVSLQPAANAIYVQSSWNWLQSSSLQIHQMGHMFVKLALAEFACRRQNFNEKCNVPVWSGSVSCTADVTMDIQKSIIELGIQ